MSSLNSQGIPLRNHRPSATKDESINQTVTSADASHESPESGNPSFREDEDGTEIRNEAWGRRTKIFMWFG